MVNPFKQYLPAEEPPQEALKTEITSSIELKSHLAALLEFFLGVLGVAVVEHLRPNNESDVDSSEPNKS